MIKCPFCQFDNEDGVSFCEQCKSDLGAEAVAPIPIEASAETPVPVDDAFVAVADQAASPPEPADIPEAIPLTPIEADSPAEAMPGQPVPANYRLVVIRGVKVNAEYPLFEGPNFIGRTDDKPVDVDLEEQEAADRIWCSRQHACVHMENGALTIEDLNSANGTFVNRTRVQPGEKRPLVENDVIQVGTVHLKVNAPE